MLTNWGSKKSVCNVDSKIPDQYKLAYDCLAFSMLIWKIIFVNVLLTRRSTTMLRNKTHKSYHDMEGSYMLKLYTVCRTVVH